MPDSGTAQDAVPGVGASRPHHIPAAGWTSVLRRVLRHVHEDRLPLLSAGIAFFAVLSIAPVLVTALSVYGAVNTPEQALRQLSGIADGSHRRSRRSSPTSSRASRPPRRRS
jgi:membrane protein